jgi:hypothetical protein
MTCNADIPPAWVAAIQSGICPGCGGSLYSEEHKELMEGLREALVEMKNADAESITGWLTSNYKLTKIGEAAPTEFHRKPTAPVRQTSSIVEQNLKVANNNVQGYFERAGVPKHLQNRTRLEAMAKQLNQIGNEDVSEDMYPGAEQEDIYINEDEAIQEQQGVLASQVLQNNSITVPSDNPNIKPLSQHEIANINSMAQRDPQAGDDIPEILQQDRMQKLRNQKAALNGAGQGSFRRGS